MIKFSSRTSYSPDTWFVISLKSMYISSSCICTFRASLSPQISASYSTALFVIEKANRTLYEISYCSGLMRSTPTPLIFSSSLDDPSTNICHILCVVCTDFLILGISMGASANPCIKVYSAIKSKRTWALMLFLGWNSTLNSLSSILNLTKRLELFIF